LKVCNRLTRLREPPSWRITPSLRDRRERSDAKLARPTGLEPATVGLEGRCSIRLSYGRIVSRIVAGMARGHEFREPPRTCARVGMVGVEGFEPPTSCSQSRRATRLRYTPSNTVSDDLTVVGKGRRYYEPQRAPSIGHLQTNGASASDPSKTKRVPQHPSCPNGAPGEIRTPDHQVRSLVLYPTELRAR